MAVNVSRMDTNHNAETKTIATVESECHPQFISQLLCCWFHIFMHTYIVNLMYCMYAQLLVYK